MASTSFSIVFDGTSDATWRVWGQALSNAIRGLGGVTVAADTGQINWATATQAAGGYEMYQFADANQGTAPVYFKITYSSGCKLTFGVATATDGAGNLAGNNFTSNQFNGGTTTTAMTGYASGTASRLTLYIPQLSSAWLIVGVERPRDNTGAEMTDGIVFTYPGNVAWISQGSGTPATLSLGSQFVCLRHEGSNLIGTQCTVFPQNPIGVNYQIRNAALSVLWYWSSDVGLGGTIACTLYGVSHTYINPHATPTGADYSAGMSSGLRAFVLYE